MASNEEISKQNEMLDAQVSTLDALSRLAQQRVVFEGQVVDEISNENDILREQLNIANKQKDGTLKNLSQQRELNKVNNQTLGIARSIQSITASELGSQKLIEKVQKDRLKVQKNIDFLQKAAQQTYSQNARINKDIQDSILLQADAAKKLVNELNTVEATSKAIANDGFLSIFDTLKDIIRVIPGLNKLLPGFDKAAESYREALVIAKQPGSIVGLGEDQAENLNSKISSYRSGDKEGTKGMSKDFIKDLPKELQDTLKGTTGTASLAILSNKFKDGVATAVSPLRAAFLSLQKFLKNFILLQFLNAIVKADKATGDLARSMNITYQESTGVMENFNEIANSSNNAFITTIGLAETQAAINKELGTSVVLSNKVLEDFTMLREQAGFTNEEIAGIRALTLATGGDAEKLTGEAMAQARITSSRLGVVINERDVVKDISKVSAATTLSLGKSEKAIAEAVTTAKALGMELSKVDAIAGSILQFESSIENELSAELLIGKELNLEAARYYALTNQTSKLAEELAGNFGTAAEFQNMGRIQQEALAKAVGMNREELAQTLYVQEQLAGVTGKEAKLREKAINARIAEVGLTQATEEIANGQLENLEKQASVQARLLAVTEKINEIFVSLAEPILAIVSPIVDALVPALSFVAGILGKISNIFGGILGYIVPIVGVMYTFQAVSSAILGIQAAYNTAKALELGLGGQILAVMGLQSAAMELQLFLNAEGNILTKIAVILENTKLGGIAKSIGLLTIQLGIEMGILSAKLAGNAAATFGVGVAVAVAAAVAGYAVIKSLSKADDLMSTPTGGSGYGDRILVGKEGAYAFNNRDTIQASTQGSPTQQSSSPSVVETKLYIDNEAFAQASSKSFSKL
jgi:hypothetical protein